MKIRQPFKNLCRDRNKVNKLTTVTAYTKAPMEPIHLQYHPPSQYQCRHQQSRYLPSYFSLALISAVHLYLTKENDELLQTSPFFWLVTSMLSMYHYERRMGSQSVVIFLRKFYS